MSLTWRQYLGLIRSLATYRLQPLRQRRWQRFYAEFIRPGELCFDVGAHVGNHMQAWLSLGARVVAVEPQPACMGLLRRWYGRHPDVELVEQAIGSRGEQREMLISERTPTVSTLVPDWAEELQRDAPTFQQVRWEQRQLVTVTTLDELISRFGEPVFCKLDIEGGETDALRGLSRPLPALSFEYLPDTKSRSLHCIELLQQLGDYRYNWTVAEQARMHSPQWLSAEQMAEALSAMPADARHGDVHARLNVGSSQS